MTKDQFIQKYLYGYDGNEEVKFDRILAILEDLAEKGCGGTQTLAAGVAGAAAIGAGTGFVAITSDHADKIVHLPAIADIQVGHIVRGNVAATGCEIRVAVADDTVAYLNNNNTTVNEAALGANCSFEAQYVGNNRWLLWNYSISGAVTAPTPD